ncbi:unnamed protein product, partial [Dovyalis caffra]
QPQPTSPKIAPCSLGVSRDRDVNAKEGGGEEPRNRGEGVKNLKSPFRFEKQK